MRLANGAADRADQTLQIRNGHLVGKFQGEGREHLLGTQLHRDQINDTPDFGMRANCRPEGCDNLRVGGLSHQQLLALPTSDDRNTQEALIRISARELNLLQSLGVRKLAKVLSGSIGAQHLA